MSLVSLAYESQHSLRQWLVGRWYARKRRGGASSLGEGWEPHHVLVVLTGLMGDSVMCTPLLSSIRRAWPRARVTLLGRRHNCELLAACPHIDAFHTVSVDPYTIRRRRQVRELRQWIASQSFDLAVIALGDQFASVIADAEVPVRVGDKGHFLEACLTHHYSIGSARSWGPDERLNALRCLGVRPVDPSSPRLWVSEPARDAARIKLLALGMRAGASYAVLHPFGSTRRQWWPPERVSELAHVLVEQWDLDVVLLGGLETKGHASLDMTRGFDATGALSVSELVAVLSDASLVISTDSGPFHVAGALGRPLVGLFRASRQEHAGRYSSAFVLFGAMNSCSPPTQPIDSTRLCARFSSTEPRQQRRPSGSATHPGVFASCAMSSAKTLSESSFCHKRRRPSCRRPGRDFVRRSSPCASRTRRCTTSGMPWIRVGKS